MGTATKSENIGEVYREIEQTLGQVPQWLRLMPEPAAIGFWGTMRDFHLADTAIPNKYKELIGLAVSGATRCRYCALFHTEAARLFGATDAEIREAAMMGAHTMNASSFLNAMQVDYDQFRKETLSIVSHVKSQMQHQAKTGQQSKGQQARA
jgi:AhpD family alkylhydroperoxidase